MSARRPIDRATRNVIHQIFHLGLTVPEEIADVFVCWSPHCDLVEVTIHAGGWHKNHVKEPGRKFAAYTTEPEKMVRLRDQLIRDVKALTDGLPLPEPAPEFRADSVFADLPPI